jgi:hypothetical protein
MGCAAVPAITYWNCVNDTVGLCPACPFDPDPIPTRFPPDKSCGRLKSGCADATLGLPIFANRTIVEQPANLETLSERYGNEIERFITVSAASGDPFFLYFAASHVHVPQNTAKAFVNKSGRSSPFADALQVWAKQPLLHTYKQPTGLVINPYRIVYKLPINNPYYTPIHSLQGPC